VTYLILFVTAFLAATLLPLSSEILLLTYLSDGKLPLLLWLAATAGNTLGAALNWVLGRYLLRFQERTWFPFKQAKLERAQKWFRSYGVWSLLFSWLPLIGDGLTFVAGTMNTRFSVFIALTLTGKAIRYGLVIWAGVRFFMA
jgi:Predicted membrane protein